MQSNVIKESVFLIILILVISGCELPINVPHEVGDQAFYEVGGVGFNLNYFPGAENFPTGVDNSGTATVDEFWAGETEVTWELWSNVYTWATTGGGAGQYHFLNEGVMGDGEDDTIYHPVAMITWQDMIVWCNALTEYYNADNAGVPDLHCVYTYNGTIIRDATDMTTIIWPDIIQEEYADGFRLLTSNEWEFSARYIDGETWTPGDYVSGATGPVTDNAATAEACWFAGNSDTSAQPVGLKPANGNALGLYDVSGNVWESCFDYDAENDKRVKRGGSWSTATVKISIGTVSVTPSDQVGLSSGFRLAKNPSLFEPTPGSTSEPVPAETPEVTPEITSEPEPTVRPTFIPDSGDPDPPYEAGDRLRYEVGTILFNMNYCPGGTDFPTEEDDSGIASVGPFRIGETELTYETWSRVYDWATAGSGSSPGVGQYTFQNPGAVGDGDGDNAQHPVTTICWRDMMVWCNALTEFYNARKDPDLVCVYKVNGVPVRDSRVTNATECDSIVPDITASGFRLLTENEWECAARYIDGTNWTPGDYASGASANYENLTVSQECAWFNLNSNTSTNLVGQKPPEGNALGLYDMSGNVWEFCFDWYEEGALRHKKGGCWFQGESKLMVGDDSGAPPAYMHYTFGMRIALNP